MIRRSTLIAVEIVLSLVAALVIGTGIAWWRLSQGPIELNAIRDHVQAELSAARGGRPVGIQGVELAWSSQGNTFELRAVGVTVEDGRGTVLSRLDRARLELEVLPLLIGRITLKRAEFIGGEVTFTRKRNGAMHIAFGPEGAPADIIIDPPSPNETLEQRVARVLDSMADAFRPVGPGGGLREVSLRQAQLTMIDEGGGGRWTADAANFELARRGRGLALIADALLEGADGQAPATLRVTTDTRFQTALIEFGTENARPRALFSQAALGPFAALDAPMTANITIGLDREAGVNQFEGDVEIGRGTAQSEAGRFSMEGGRFHGRYDVESDELIIDELALAGERTRVNGEVRVHDVSAIMRAAPNEASAFNVSLASLRLDVPGTFAEPIAFSNVEIAGSITGADRSIRFTRLSAENGEALVRGQGRIYWAEAGEGAERRLRPGVELTGDIQGSLDARVVTSVWPMGLGESARSFLHRTLQQGRVTDAVVRLDIRPSDIAAGVWRNEAVDITFNVNSGQMQFVSTMSPVTAARGSGHLRGNSFQMTIPEARLNGMAVTNGRVDIPRLKNTGPNDFATISARVEGDARHILEVLGQEPIALGERLPVNAATATGRGTVNIRLQRPMEREVPFERWRFTVDGSIRDFAGQMSTRNLALSRGQLTVRGDQRAITVSGPVRAGTSAIQSVRWTEHLNRRGRSSSEYQIAGDFDAADLVRLGYSVASNARGRVGVTVTGQGRGFDVDDARIEVDLTNAVASDPWGLWSKRAGQAATVSFDAQRQPDGSITLANLDARGSGLNTQGTIRLARNNEIASVDLTRLGIEGSADARLTAARAPDGGLNVNVRGALFDAAPFMGGSDDEEETPAASATPISAQAPGTRAATNEPPIRATVIVDRLKMRGGATLENARVELTTTRGALMALVAEGRSPGDRAFSLALGPRPTDPRGGVRFRSDDAGFAVRALTGADNVVGGTASADGAWRGGPPSQARFNVRMRNFQIVRLPAMARLLSSAGSLTGLVEMLNGDGIGFQSLDAEMTYANERLAFTEGRMAGPSLGLTGAGNYDMRRDNLDIDGVVAPSPLLNLSMLGEVPVIGDLLVSRRGEGVFGMTYSINGRAGEPRVGVNPASALTPGIFRRIFEPAPSREGTTGGAHSLPLEPEAVEQPAEATPPPQPPASAAEITAVTQPVAAAQASLP
jgi:hypothetical protein